MEEKLLQTKTVPVDCAEFRRLWYSSVKALSRYDNMPKAFNILFICKQFARGLSLNLVQNLQCNYDLYYDFGRQSNIFLVYSNT